MGDSFLAHNSWVFGSDNTLFCSGYNESGQLGLGSTQDAKELQQFLGQERIVSVASGYQHTLLISASGKLYAFGANDKGQLGFPSNPKNLTPTLLPGGQLWASASCGQEHSLAITKDGKLYAWGSHEYGQLGIGQSSAQNIFSPVLVQGLAGKKVLKVQAGFQHSFAWTDDGQVYSWGKNDMGQLCNRTCRQFDVPNPINIGLDVKFLSTGDTHTFIVNSQNQIYAIGFFHREFDFGQSPVLIGQLNEPIIAFAGGVFHCLALTSSKTIWGYGQNGYKQVGIEKGPNLKTFERISLPGNATPATIACGYHHSLVVTTDGKLIAWGAQSRGQLGNGLQANFSLPTVVPVPVKVASVVRAPRGPPQISALEETVEEVHFAPPSRGGGDKDAIIKDLRQKNAEQAALIERLQAELTSLKTQVTYQSQAKTLEEVGTMNISFVSR